MSIVSLSSKVHDKIQKKVLEPKKKPTNKFSTKSGKRIKPPTKKKGILNDVLSEAKKIIKPKKKQAPKKKGYAMRGIGGEKTKIVGGRKYQLDKRTGKWNRVSSSKKKTPPSKLKSRQGPTVRSRPNKKKTPSKKKIVTQKLVTDYTIKKEDITGNFTPTELSTLEKHEKNYKKYRSKFLRNSTSQSQTTLKEYEEKLERYKRELVRREQERIASRRRRRRRTTTSMGPW